MGRESIVEELLAKLQGQTRLLWIKGISGIGKTTLGEFLASKVWEKERSFEWIYLEILEGQSPDFASVAAELLAKLGDRELDPEERNNPERLAKRLLQKLQSHSYWIQMDSLERLLNPEQPNQFVDAYWATFLQRFLTDSNVVSRLVLTAQALATALVEFSDRYPNTWVEYRLNGLLQLEQLEFFAKRGVVVEPSNQDILTRIAKIYEGHPLVLKVIAEDILQEFAGDVDRYWQVYQPEFEQVARELQATRLDETEYNEALDCKVRERIKKSLEQLPADALDLLCRSAVFRRPVPKKFWLAMIGDRSSKQQKVAYRVLGDRALIEKEGTDIRQHNLIRAIGYDLLRADIPTWHHAERQAAHLWLTAYEPASDAPNLEKVRGYLEAFDHRYEAQDYVFLSEFLPEHSQELDQLQNWGYYREMIDLYGKPLDKLEDAGAVICAIRLGNAYYFLSNYSQALKYWNYGRILAQKINNHYWEGRALGNLAIIYFYQANYQQAIEINHEYLNLSRSISDRMGEAHALGGLAVSNHMLGDYSDAIAYYQQELFIRREINDKTWEINALTNLGESYAKLSDYRQAIDCYEESLRQAKDVGNRYVEARSLRSLGSAYSHVNNCQSAIQCCQEALIITREIGNRYEEASALHVLGSSMIKLSNFSEGKEYLMIALNIYRELGNRDDESEALLDLANLHHKLGSLVLALDNCEQAWVIATELGIPRVEECHQLRTDLLKESKSA